MHHTSIIIMRKGLSSQWKMTFGNSKLDILVLNEYAKMIKYPIQFKSNVTFTNWNAGQGAVIQKPTVPELSF